MADVRHAPGRQRPAAAFGPARDADRDNRIIQAALALIAEGGYEALSMEKVAARALVGKATVYRRWASKADLAADAVETLGFAVEPEHDEPQAATLREDLHATLIATTGCLDGQRHQLVSAMLATSHNYPELTTALRLKFVECQRNAIGHCLERAVRRGEVDADRVAELLIPGRMEITSIIALIVHFPSLNGGNLSADDVEHMIDQVLLPLTVAGNDI